MISVLLVEDDKKLAEHIQTQLQSEGCQVLHAQVKLDLDVLLDAKKNEFDIVILDRLLGQFDTKELVPKMRKLWPSVSILVLSAINTPLERSELLNLGADDYMGKPFLSQELMARIRVLTRRSANSAEKYRQLGNTILDLQRRSFSVNDKNEVLPSKEFMLLKVLSDDTGRVISKNEILDTVWGTSSYSETNVVEATITHLRKRLSSLGSTLEIRNMRNTGYWIET